MKGWRRVEDADIRARVEIFPMGTGTQEKRQIWPEEGIDEGRSLEG